MAYEQLHVVVIGHSYIRRLAEFMQDNLHRANLGLDHRRVTVHCFGLGGASFRAGNRCIVDHVHTVMSRLSFVPHIVYLHIGENDVMYASTQSLCENLLHLIHLLSRVYHVPITIVSQLLPFPVLEHLRYSVTAANSALEHACRTNCKIVYWKHRGGFWNSVRNLYLSDKVHLNATGQLQYWRSVHRAVSNAVQTLRSNAH
jgi:hypothetical protein